MVNKQEWFKKYARFGMAAKGLVYVLIGILTAVAAFNLGAGNVTGKKGAFGFILNQPYGKVLLGLTGLILLGYVFWRGIQAIKDPEDEGVWRRIGYAFSGLFYTLVAGSAFTMAFSGSGGDGGSGKQEQFIGQLLDKSWGKWAVIIIAMIFFGKAIWQFYRAYSGKFDDKLKGEQLDSRVKNIIKIFGKTGYTSRGIVIAVIGFLFLRAALRSDPSQAGGTEEAFNLIQQATTGSIILGIIALGLAAYGVFMFIKANYRVMPSL